MEQKNLIDSQKQTSALQLQERSCANPKCSIKFRVLATSTQAFHSKACEIETDPKTAAKARSGWGNPHNREWEAKAAINALKEQKAQEERRRQDEKIAQKMKHEAINKQYIADEGKKTEEVAQQSNPDMERFYKVSEDNARRSAEEQAASNVVELTKHGNPKRNRGDNVLFKHSIEVSSPSGQEIKKQELEKKWLFYVQQGQQIIDRMGKDRLEVARLAIEACEINHGGGGHWNNFEGVFTLARYAKEIGISYKTLHNWVRIKRNVYDKLIDGGVEVDLTKEWRVLNSMSARCDKDQSVDEVVRSFKKWSLKAEENGVVNPERYLLQGLRRLRSLNHFFIAHNPSKKQFDKQDLDELKSLCNSVVRWLEK